jgi:hypothetical protein
MKLIKLLNGTLVLNLDQVSHFYCEASKNIEVHLVGRVEPLVLHESDAPLFLEAIKPHLEPSL